MSRPSVFLYVQHLLGIGHLKRSLLIARALAQTGYRVTVASGGHEVPLLDRSGLEWVQLPPASAADLTFRNLLDAQGRPVDERWKSERAALLLDAWTRASAEVLLLELFPFGRRQMRFELLPLLEAARSAARPPLVVSSIRDVLGGGQGDPERQLNMLALFEKYFDHVLVHGDPSLIPLDLSFGPTPQLGTRLHYTGYVVDPAVTAAQSGAEGAGEVLVSAGGGAVGMPLLEAAILARPLSRLHGRRWRILAGSNVSESHWQGLTRMAGQTGEGQVLVERARPDFVAMLGRCAVSVSQGGYNTVLEVLSQRARAVVVPFAAAGEVEQSLRARVLEQKGLIHCVAEESLSAQTLAAAVDRASLAPAPVGQIRFDGAQRTVEWLSARLLDRSRQR